MGCIVAIQRGRYLRLPATLSGIGKASRRAGNPIEAGPNTADPDLGFLRLRVRADYLFIASALQRGCVPIASAGFCPFKGWAGSRIVLCAFRQTRRSKSCNPDNHVNPVKPTLRAKAQMIVFTGFQD